MTDEQVLAALQEVLRPLGTHLRHYEARHRDAAVAAMRKVLDEVVKADRLQRVETSGLTTQQAACLRAIAEHQAQHGISPTLDELAAALGLASKSGVARLLLALETRGRILRAANRSRAITIIPTPAS